MATQKILYIHGFGSAGSTGTAILLRNVFYAEGHDIQVLSPDVPVMPLEALAYLRQLVADEQPDLIIGTSMGGMYAELLRGWPRILVNPSFHMARLLTFRGMGNYDFQNKRADGARTFKVDRTMIQQFQQIEKQESLRGVTPDERELVWGLFGNNDPTVHTQPDFAKAYGRDHLVVFDGEHRLNDKVVKHDLLPIVRQMLHLDK